MSLDESMVLAIREQVGQGQKQITALGVMASRTYNNDAMVTFDGSTNAVPVKVFGTVTAHEGDRVGLVKFGAWWVVVGSFTKRWPADAGASLTESSPGGTTTSGTYADLPTTVECTYTKLWDTTRTRVALFTSSTSSVAGTVVYFGVNFTSASYAAAAYDITLFCHNLTSTHCSAADVRYIPSLGPGTYNVRVQWKRVSGTGTLAVDQNDLISLSVSEVAA